jgi:hypothetical protein
LSDFPPPPDSPPYLAPPPRRGIPSGLVIAVGVTAAVVITAVAGGLALYVGSRLPRPAASAQTSATPSTGDLTASSGTVVFSDDFHDSSSGWDTTAFGSGTFGAYTGGHFVIVAKGHFNHFFQSPYTTAQTGMSMSVTATQSADAPSGAGFGVSCDSGRGNQHVRYQFLVEVGRTYQVLTKVGPDGGTVLSNVIRNGISSVDPGTSPLTVTGDCITQPDGVTTRLIFFINGAKVADFTDVTTVATTGWFSAIDVASEASRDSTLTVTKFEERTASA